MSQERNNTITFKGGTMTLVGPELKVGQTAPDFKLIANDLSEVTLSSTAGKTRIIVTVPSLDTPVCDMEARRFNQEVAKLSNVSLLIVSMDLPFAQKRYCGTNGIESAITVSDYRGARFSESYGLLIKELYLSTRAVLVLDPQNKITYMEIVPEVTNEPNYEAALKAASAVLATV